MENQPPNQPLLDDPRNGSHSRNGFKNNLLPLRPQYMEVPYPEVFEEPGSGQLHEYFQIFRRRKGTLILIAFLGLLTSLLLTLPQTRIYQATRIPSRFRI